ncbi:UDP-N-acetylmuramoyl-L-alanyl-D-glutamate--2,6-diaminopimelate ligase [Mobilicoccus pelagius]|nr:UDP-N-acetylmuramoyl-L-alanyl-D-glutamate--2,6-diaminopimelate ligase [Mobilicoccus pelagius]
MTAPSRPQHLAPTPLSDLVSDDVRIVGDAESVEVTGASLDNRRVVPGDLYAALPGAHVHGALFAAAAVDSGARAVLTDEAGLALLRDAGPLPVPVILADDPRAVLGEISARIYDRPAERLRTVGITGTNGKTTTAYLLDGALRALGRTTGLVGTIEIRVGESRVDAVRTTPESCDLQALLAVMAERDVTDLTMEVSSHALALHRVDGVVYDVACFTNLSQDHLDFHRTMEAYYEAKASLFTPERARHGVVCVDDDWGRRLAAETTIPVVTVANSADRRADWVIASRPGESKFTLTPSGALVADGARALHLASPLPGDFNRTNTAVAALALLTLGTSSEDAERGLAGDMHVPGRAETVDLGPDAPRAIVDFAHTPDAVASVLAALRPGTEGPLVAVLGAGGERDPGKRPHMGAAAARYADHVVVTDDNPRHEDPAEIRAAVLAGATAALEDARDSRGEALARDAVEVAGRENALVTALGLAGPTGTVAVLGKGHETGQQIGDVVHPYDDRSALTRAWQRRPAPTSDPAGEHA